MLKFFRRRPEPEPEPIWQFKSDLVEPLSKERLVLEIGPFNNPMIRGDNVRYFDVMTTEQLVKRAKKVKYDKNTIPNIDYSSPDADLSVINERFSAVASSHCIEHQPDLIHHLNQVRYLIEGIGRYYLVIPDKRYCFDHSVPSSTLEEVISAQGDRRHPLIKVIEHRAVTTHNDPTRHWSGDHYDADWEANQPAKARKAITEYLAAKGGYVDVHRWQFTPQTFKEIIVELCSTGLIPFEIEMVNETPQGQLEFVAILRVKEEEPPPQKRGWWRRSS